MNTHDNEKAAGCGDIQTARNNTCESDPSHFSARLKDINASPEPLTEVPDQGEFTTNQKIVSKPIFGVASNQSDKTDKSDFSSISNDTFIAGIFGEIPGNERPVVVSFLGNPSQVSKKAWFGVPWMVGKTEFNPEHNQYLSFASFRPDESGHYRRQKKQFAALYAVMLDDIGSKVPLERIRLQPSWVIETSERNFQIGFILETPITDSGKQTAC